jgi:hypothetical protein
MSHRLEPELEGEPKRTIPPEIQNGPYARARRRTLAICFTCGVLFLLCSFLPIFQKWGLFFLPFAYLSWIGAGLVALSILLFVQQQFALGSLEYVVGGLTIPAKIVNLQLQQIVLNTGQIGASFHYQVTVEFLHPEHDSLETSVFLLEPTRGALIDQYEVTHQIGDTVTLVYLPGRIDKTIQLYSSLKLRSDIGLIRKPQWADPGNSMFKSVAFTIGLFSFFFMMFWCLYALSRYKPLVFTMEQGILAGIGAVVVGGAYLFHLLLKRYKKQQLSRESDELGTTSPPVLVPVPGRFSRYFGGFILFLGFLLLGAIMFLCTGWTLNAWLDNSGGRTRPVVITETIQKTYKMIFRTYEMKFEFLDDPSRKTHEIGTTPQEINQFTVPFGRADIRSGCFGWEWLNTIEPVPGNLENDPN